MLAFENQNTAVPWYSSNDLIINQQQGSEVLR